MKCGNCGAEVNEYQTSCHVCDVTFEGVPKRNGLRRFFSTGFGRLVLTLIFACIIWGGSFALTSVPVHSNPEVGLIMGGIYLFFGWRALSMIQPAMFLWLDWYGWVLYFMIKTILSLIIGVFVAPFIIGRWLANLISG